MRLDPRVPGEGQLRDVPAPVRVERLTGQPDRADRAIRTPVPDPEPADLDRHRGDPA